MAIAPSNNLLSALSQLQSNRPASAPRPATAAPAGPANANIGSVGAAPSSFAAQLAAPADAIRTAAPQRIAAVPSAQPVNQPPIPARGGYLGQHVNIVV